MGDLVLGTPPVIETAGWRDGLRQWAVAERRLHGTHPWLAQLPISGPPTGPNATAWLDAGLRGLRGTGLDWRQAGRAHRAQRVRPQLRTAVTGAGRRPRRHGRDAAEVARSYGRTLALLVDDERFPEAAELFGSDLFETAPARRQCEGARCDTQ